jgi:hypothetical protein
MGIVSVETFGSFCHRYGPGRLPGASRPAVGAGYAVATAALAAAVAFVVLTTLLSGGPIAETGSLTHFGLLAIPLVVPVAFAGGAVAWRLLPESQSYRGSLAGMLATVLTYVGTALLVVLYFFAFAPSEPMASLGAGLLVGIVGFILTFWLTLPIGAVSGWIHERTVTEH